MGREVPVAAWVFQLPTFRQFLFGKLQDVKKPDALLSARERVAVLGVPVRPQRRTLSVWSRSAVPGRGNSAAGRLPACGTGGASARTAPLRQLLWKLFVPAASLLASDFWEDVTPRDYLVFP